jgi:hypothetical protein
MGDRRTVGVRMAMMSLRTGIMKWIAVMRRVAVIK